MDEDDVTITDIDTSKNGKEVVVEYQITGIATSKQKKAKKTVESSSMASAIEKDLKKGGYDKVDVDKADAEVTTVTVVSDSNDDTPTTTDDVTDVPQPAVAATQVFSGVTLAEASQPTFQTAVAAAVAKKLDVDEDDVTITSTATIKDGKDVVVKYTVKGIKSGKQNQAMKTVESSSMASAIEKDLKEQGFKKADVDKAEAIETSVVIIDNINDDMTDIEVPAVAVSQSFARVTVDQAEEPSFQKTLIAAVAEKLKVDVEDVTITKTTESINGKEVVVEYQVEGQTEIFLLFSYP